MTDKNQFIKQLGQNVDKIRKEKGLSFQEMALRCDIEKSSLVKLANQGTNVTVSTIFKISKALEVEPKELFNF